jgi:hypothetical protein
MTAYRAVSLLLLAVEAWALVRARSFYRRR